MSERRFSSKSFGKKFSSLISKISKYPKTLSFVHFFYSKIASVVFSDYRPVQNLSQIFVREHFLISWKIIKLNKNHKPLISKSFNFITLSPFRTPLVKAEDSFWILRMKNGLSSALSESFLTSFWISKVPSCRLKSRKKRLPVFAASSTFKYFGIFWQKSKEFCDADRANRTEKRKLKVF